MYISSLRIENFKSFYGVHDFTFSQGVNVVLGLCGEGKTSLCRAIEFGLFGGLHCTPGTPSNHQQPTSNLINVRHIEECKRENRFYECNVELIFVKGEETYRIERSQSFFQPDEANESLYYPPDMTLGLNRIVFNDLIYLSEDIPEIREVDFDSGLSFAERMSLYLENQVELNIKDNIKMVILDGVFDRFAQEKKKSIFEKLASRGLEQVIMLETPAFYETSLDDLVSKKYRLGTTIETVEVTVEDFPFPASVLKERVSYLLDGMYIYDRESYHEQVFNQKYTVNISNVEPNGGRFSEKETQIMF